MQYYQAGYYLIKINPVDFGSIKNRKIMTASTCFNSSYFDIWALSWSNDGQDKSWISKEFGLSEERVEHLQSWADESFNLKKVGWENIFYSLEDINNYKNEYFKDRKDLVILGLSFPEIDIEDLLEDFKPQNEKEGEIGLRYSLRQRTPENPKGQFLGYDIVGIELGGSFHTIHCHGLQDELTEKFGLEFYDNGLVKSCGDWQGVSDFCNDEENGLEPVPWYYCRVKLYE